MTSTRNPWQSLAAGLLVGLATGGIVLATGSEGEEGIREVLRWSGRVSFLLFLVPLCARPLHDLISAPATAALLTRRGNFGLAFAGNHFIHLGFIIHLYRISPTQPVDDSVFWGGTFGMLYLASMAVLTFEAPVRAAGPRITAALHKLGLYYLTAVFLYDFAFKNPFGTYPLLFSIWCTAVGLRVVAWFVARSRTNKREVAAAG